MEGQLQALAKSFSQASSLEGLTRPLLCLLQAVTGLESTFLARVEAGPVVIDYAGPSIGVVSWQAEAYADADVLVAEADKAMYEDKQRRRSGFQAESKRV